MGVDSLVIVSLSILVILFFGLAVFYDAHNTVHLDKTFEYYFDFDDEDVQTNLMVKLVLVALAVISSVILCMYIYRMIY